MPKTLISQKFRFKTDKMREFSKMPYGTLLNVDVTSKMNAQELQEYEVYELDVYSVKGRNQKK